MSRLSTLSSPKTPVDEDLVDQAHPGHGIPSQDTDPAAQTVLEPDEAMREAQSALAGGSVVAGAATGAAIGGAVGGPVGIVVGVAVGAVAGALGGAAVASATQDGDDAQDTADRPVAGIEPSPAEAVRLHIEDSGGGGRPVVLIHGWPLSAQAWEPQVSALRAAGYRVVAYDRRGFGRSDKPQSGYGYDTLADDLHRVLDQCGLQDATLVGFSMGGGEVARLIGRSARLGRNVAARLHSVVFAAAVPPFLMHSANNPEGPLSADKAAASRQALADDRDAFFEQFTRNFFSANGVLQVTEFQRAEAVALCQQAAQQAALACMDAFDTTDFRDDLKQVLLPTLVIHGDADAIVPIEGSGLRTHRSIRHSQLVRVSGAPHGLNLSHARAFNDALLQFLRT